MVLIAVGIGLTGLLYQTTTSDPLTFAGVTILLAVAGLIAMYIPARRAALADPATAFRSE